MRDKWYKKAVEPIRFHGFVVGVWLFDLKISIKKNCRHKSTVLNHGADKRTWTSTELPRLEPESSASANSAISACHTAFCSFYTIPYSFLKFKGYCKIFFGIISACLNANDSLPYIGDGCLYNDVKSCILFLFTVVKRIHDIQNYALVCMDFISNSPIIWVGGGIKMKEEALRQLGEMIAAYRKEHRIRGGSIKQYYQNCFRETA